MKYGRQLTITRDGDLTTAQEEIYANWATVKQVTVCTETVFVKDEQEALVEFLKLIDRQKKGEIEDIGLQCLKNKNTDRLRVEKTWVAL